MNTNWISAQVPDELLREIVSWCNSDLQLFHRLCKTCTALRSQLNRDLVARVRWGCFPSSERRVYLLHGPRIQYPYLHVYDVQSVFYRQDGRGARYGPYISKQLNIGGIAMKIIFDPYDGLKIRVYNGWRVDGKAITDPLSSQGMTNDGWAKLLAAVRFTWSQ